MAVSQVADFYAALSATRKAGCDALRAAGPVVKMDGIFRVTQREHVLEALNNPQVFSSFHRPRGGSGFDVVDLPAIPTGLDPPDHTRYRKVLQPLFGPHVLEEVLPAFTEQAATLIGTIVGDGACNALPAVIIPYVNLGLMTLCGLPSQDAAAVNQLKHTIHSPPNANSYRRAVLELVNYVAQKIRERRANPSRFSGAFCRMATLLSEKDAVAAAYSMIGGASDGQGSVIAYALAALACDPQLRRALRDDPEQIKPFVGEILRLQPPVANLMRVCTQDFTIGGVTIPAGAPVALDLSAANREETDNMCLAAPNRQWTFGHGPHRCPGDRIARAQIAVLITEWLRRIPEFELQPGHSTRLDAVFQGTPFALPSLPLRWAA
jgi:cytochrome P450